VITLKRETIYEEFREFLKKGEYRITPERFEVLDHALNYKGHFGADELYIQMKTNHSYISRATVYNTLEILAKCCLLTKRNFGEKTTRYESNLEKETHDHLICITCGTIKEFANPKIQKVIKDISIEQGFEPTGYSFNVFGKCSNSNCRQKKNAQ